MARTPGSSVFGFGSAKEGVEHWWWQRVTAVALIPLSLWFGYSMVSLMGEEHQVVKQWMQQPLQMTLLLAFVAALLYHAKLGLQVVIEDYVHHEGVKIGLLVAVKLAAALSMIWTAVVLFSLS